MLSCVQPPPAARAPPVRMTVLIPRSTRRRWVAYALVVRSLEERSAPMHLAGAPCNSRGFVTVGQLCCRCLNITVSHNPDTDCGPLCAAS